MSHQGKDDPAHFGTVGAEGQLTYWTRLETPTTVIVGTLDRDNFEVGFRVLHFSVLYVGLEEKKNDSEHKGDF
jgi:hypothetical protein